MKYLLAAMTLSATAAVAAPATTPITEWDVNHDGALSRVEAAQAQQNRFDMYDANEDGDLSGLERQKFDSHLAFRQSQIPALMAADTPDANGDGLISAGEFARWTDALFTRLDQSGDGLLTPMEVAEF